MTQSCRTIAAICFFVLAAAVVSGAEAMAALRGRVIDLATGLPIANATVSGPGLATAITDMEGRFVCSLNGGPLSVVEVQAAGYLPQTARLDADAAEREIAVALARSFSFAEQVEVTGKAGPPPTEVSRTIEARTVATTPGALEDGLQALASQPGVVTRDGFTGRLYVRGGRPDQNGVYLDGIPVYDPYRLFGLTSIFNPEMLSKMTLLPGGFDAKYGDRLSAVIAGENRVGVTDRSLAGSASISLTSTNLRAEGKLGLAVPSSWLVSLRRTYYDVVAPNTSLPTFGDIQARLLVEPTPSDRITLTVLGSREDSNLKIDERQFDNVPKSHADVLDAQRDLIAGVQAQHIFSDRLLISSVLSRTSDRQKSNIFVHEGETGFETRLVQDLDDAETRFATSLTGRYGRHSLEGGVEMARSENTVNFGFLTDDPRVVIPDSFKNFANRQDYSRFGSFAQDTVTLSSSVDLKLGLRWDRSDLSGTAVTSPRASFAWRPAPRWELVGAWGDYYQSPSYQSLQGDGFVLDLRGIRELHLRPEHAEHFLTRAGYESENGWKLGVDLYEKQLTDLLDSGKEKETILVLDENDQAHPYVRDTLTYVPENSRRGYSRGAQVVFTLLEGRGRPFYGMLAYTYGQVRSRDATTWRWEDYDQRHSVVLMGGWRFARSWQLGWRWQYATGFPFTPLRNVIRVVDDRDGDGVFNPAAGDTLTYQRDEPDAIVNTARLPAYHRLDLRVEYTHRGVLTWTYYLDIINTYARKNVEEYVYNADFTQRTSNNGLPIVPSFGVRATF